MTEVRVPDIGDFADVPVIEVLVAPGDTVAPEDPLITLESDKATMDIPAPAAGVIAELAVHVGDRVSEGSLVLTLEPASGDGAAPAAPAGEAPAAARRRDRPPRPPATATSSASTSSSSAPGRAATPPRSGPPTSGSRPCWSSATPGWAACASTSAASPR